MSLDIAVSWVKMKQLPLVRSLTIVKSWRILIEQHRGRIVDSPGDNVLAEFASVVDAAQCAVAVQKEMKFVTPSYP